MLFKEINDRKYLSQNLEKGAFTLKLMQISWQIPEQYLHDQGNENCDTVFINVDDS